MNDSNDLDLLSDLISRARAAGADEADVILVRSTSQDATWRMGRNEGVERSEANDLGLRVLIGKRQAVVSTTDLGAGAIAEIVERALAMAKAVPEDPYCGLPDIERLAVEIPDLDLSDDSEPSSDDLLAWAEEAEDAARGTKGITNSEGAEAGWSEGRVALAASNGFAGTYRGTRFGVSVSVVAGSGTGMERDYEFLSARHCSDLETPAAVGARAAERAVRRLNPRKQKSAQVPVVFDPRVSGGFLRLLAAVVSGNAIARGTSFLQEKLGEAVFAPGISIIDDPLRPRGLSSRPFDGEGVAGEHRALIDDGRLTTWLLDSRSARQLGLQTTGHAARGPSGPPAPSPSNLSLSPGSLTPEALIGEIDGGLY
ncbi:MAG: TldD/PmbA family protein, partial [Alphaproteobacteria bacterium]|nr:TldD/PmbA family protein [Alphaproteobacteria bacterium]